jgi:protein TonB
MASNRPPSYPESARRRGIQGHVLLRVSVSADGAPVSVSVAQSSGAASLDDAAVTAVRQWRFVPASQGSRPIPGTAEVPIDFRLEQ